MVVSKPCAHPECPPRSGIIRGQYESVEIIREIPAEPPAAKRSYSSADLSAREKSPAAKSAASDVPNGTKGPPPAIEWLMVTRSDPGGSVPRFMIEKGTPPGIVNDAGKFLEWVDRIINGVEETTEEQQDPGKARADSDTKATVVPSSTQNDVQPAIASNRNQQQHSQQHDTQSDAAWSTNGLYGMITGAFAAATSVVSGGLQRPYTTQDQSDIESFSGRKDGYDYSSSETSSLRSFTSALEKSLSAPAADGAEPVTDSVQGSQREDKSQGSQVQARELRRLEDRRRRLDEKATKMMERLESKRSGDQEKDAAAMAKLREKHEKEIAKQEAKYKREMKRLEDKKDQEQRKAEERRKKQIEREEKASAAVELDRVKTERDIALKQIDLLKQQVGDLQAENTQLAAKLGRVGVLERTDSAPAPSTMGNVGRARSTSKVTS